MDSTPTLSSSDEIGTAPNQVNLNIMNGNNGGLHPSPATAANALTPEQEQERQLKDKYPNPQRPGGSAFIQKILNRGNKKYFDSGDYNMAKSKSKSATLKGSNSLGMPTPPTNMPSSMEEQTTTPADTCPTITSNPTAATPTIVIENQSPMSPASTPTAAIESNSLITSNATTTNNNTTSPHIVSNTISNSNSVVLTPTHPSTHHHQQQTSPLSSNINIVNHNNTLTSPMVLSNSLSSSALTSNSNLLNSLNNNHHHHPTSMMPTSMSTQSINMLSASLSSEKIANIHINPAANPNLLDTDEIGHGIPTPECLPQSRKHSIVQSKLATPRLSSS